MSNTMKISLAATLFAFSLSASTATAQSSVAAVGQGFVKALMKDAMACKDKITGINLTSVKALAGCLVEAVKKAGKAALLDLARALFDEAMKLLKTNAPAAKQKLGELGSKVAAFLPAVKQFIDPVVQGISKGGDAMVAEAVKCKAQIKAIDLASLKGTFQCLGTALKTGVKVAGVAILQGLFEEGIKLLEKGCSLATGKLGALAKKIAELIPQAKGMIEPVINAISSGCQGAVDKVSQVKLPR